MVRTKTSSLAAAILILFSAAIILYLLDEPNENKTISTGTNNNVIMKGEIYEYSWIKSSDNFDYAQCHDGGYGTVVFIPKNSGLEFHYRIEFKDNIDAKDYQGKSVTIKGNKIIEQKEVKESCPEYSQCPVGEGDSESITCYKIIDAEIMEITDCVNFNDSTEDAPEAYKILLKARTFIPPQGIECSLLNDLKTSENIHVILQFYSTPSIQQRTELETRGIYLVGYLPQRSYFALVPSSEKQLHEIINRSYVRWIGNILPDDKFHEDLRENQIGYWAIDEKGHVILQVGFHDDISQEQIYAVAEKYGELEGEIVKSINTAVISIPQDKIKELSEEDSVMWIEAVPPPATTDRQYDLVQYE